MSIEGIQGKAAVVTGAARGIGREYARALAGAGASVACSDVQDELGQETADLINKDGGTAIYVHGDVSDETSMVAMADEVVAQLGSLDILVNNAGMWGGLEFESPLEISRELWDRVIGVNVTGVWLATKACAAKMVAQGGGVIVNQSSIGSYLGGPLLSHYCTSKSAVNGLTKAMARDLAEENIRVNAIAPGIITTEATMSNVGEELLDALEATQAIKRRGTTEDLLGPLLFLCSDASAFITGQVLVVDGGGVLLG